MSLDHYVETMFLRFKTEESLHYTWITDRVAIGDFQSSYEPFDVVVNLNYDGNGVTHGVQKKEVVGTKTIYRIGIYDSPQEEPLMSAVLTYMMSELDAFPDKKILFHCYAGVSRSSTLAIAYLARQQNASVEETLALIVSKRPIVRPNPGFMNSLRHWTQ